MSTVLALCTVAAAAWLVVSLVGAHRRTRSATGESVAGFSRALGALDPANNPRGRQSPPGRSAARSPSAPAPRARARGAPAPPPGAPTAPAAGHRRRPPVRRSADMGARKR